MYLVLKVREDFKMIRWGNGINFWCRVSGLVQNRDESHLSPNRQPYVTLPSPNVPTDHVNIFWPIFVILNVKEIRLREKQGIDYRQSQEI
jgi:hypothetical protein